MFLHATGQASRNIPGYIPPSLVPYQPCAGSGHYRFVALAGRWAPSATDSLLAGGKVIFS